MGIQINGNTNNINAGIGSLSIEDLNELDIIGVATASNFKTGTSNVHSTGYECTNINATGIITATKFVGPFENTGDFTIDDYIVHAGDTNTKFGFPANDQFSVETAGDTRFHILSNGNIEVATTTATSPAYLRFNSNRSNADDALGGIHGIWNGNSVAGVNFKTGADTGNKDDGRIQFVTYTGGTPYARMMILEDGKIGINLSVPTRPLHIASDEDLTSFTGTTKGAFCISNNDYANGEYSAIDFTYTGSDNPIGRIATKITSGGSSLHFGTSNNYSSGITNEALVIDKSGRLLLGAGAIATPKSSGAGGLDLDNGSISLVVGGNENSTGRTDGTSKINRIAAPHRTNSEEPVAMLSCQASTSTNTLFYGGGSSYTNAVTAHKFYTAGDSTTTTGTERIRLVANGQMIVGEANTSPVSDLEVRKANAGGDVAIRIGNNSNQDSGTTASLYFTTSPTQNFNTFYIQAARSDGSTRFGYGSSENMRLSSDGNLSIRTTGTPNFDRSADYGLYIAGSTYSKAGMAIRVDSNDDNPASIVLAKSRSSGDTIVGNSDDVGQLDFMANDGNGFHTIARVAASMDGENSTVGNNDMPGNLRFFTCEDGGTSLKERARIHSWGGLELSDCKIDYGSCDSSHSYFYTFHKSGTYGTFYVDIGFMNPGGYNLEMMMGGYNNRKMHTTMQGYVYNGSHYGGVGAIDSGNGPQRSWSNIGTYGSYGTKMRFSFTSMSSTHTVVTMRLSFGPAGGSGRATRAEIYDVQWS